MRIAALVELNRREKLPPLQRNVLRYLEAHPEDVFQSRDQQLASDVGSKPSSVGFSLWALHKRGLIDRETAAGKVYFGSKDAIAKLRTELGIPAGDPFARASANLARIREVVGNIDVQALLDEVREGR